MRKKIGVSVKRAGAERGPHKHITMPGHATAGQSNHVAHKDHKRPRRSGVKHMRHARGRR